MRFGLRLSVFFEKKETVCVCVCVFVCVFVCVCVCVCVRDKLEKKGSGTRTSDRHRRMNGTDDE